MREIVLFALYYVQTDDLNIMCFINTLISFPFLKIEPHRTCNRMLLRSLEFSFGVLFNGSVVRIWITPASCWI